MAAAHPLVDHDEIREWAEERGARPACVRGTGRRKADTGMIRIDFPGWSGEESLQEIPWEEWFRQFDENNLALLVQEETARGQKSNFNKLVSREAAEGKVPSRRRAGAKRAGAKRAGAKRAGAKRAAKTGRGSRASKAGSTRRTASARGRAAKKAVKTGAKRRTVKAAKSAKRSSRSR